MNIKKRILDSVGEGQGVMTSENSTETCILPYVKQITSPSSILELGHSNRALKVSAGDNPEERDRKGGGRGFQDGGHIYTCGWFMSMYGKNNHNIIKLLASN